MPHPWEVKWKVGKRLGKGGQGIAHEVVHVADAAIHGALKYLRNNGDPQSRSRMRREVANLQTLANQGGSVPHVLDENTGEFEDPTVELFVVMDLICGSTLRDYVDARGPLGIEIAVPMVLSLCRTVEIAHTFPILHRDLKPENIIVRNDNVTDLVIVDYGLSFNVTDDPITETDETFRNRFLDLPETNTPGGDRRDPRSDLTAVCAILYFCLSKNAVGQLQDSSGTLPHLRGGHSLRSFLGNDARLGQVEAFLTRGLSPNIANRFQDVSEIVKRLTALVETSKDVDESDPLQVAAALSDQIRLTDRKTQIAEFKQHADKLFEFLQLEHKKYDQKLGRFSLVHSGGGGGFFGPPVKIQFPEGLDMVANWDLVLTLQASHHPQQKKRQFSVASCGEQCVLLACDYSAIANAQVADKPLDKWHEVAWFTGIPDPIFPIAALSYREWVTAMVKKLAAEILPRHAGH